MCMHAPSAVMTNLREQTCKKDIILRCLRDLCLQAKGVGEAQGSRQ